MSSRRSRRRGRRPAFEEKALDLTTFPADLLATPTLSGPSITPATALTVPAVASAVQLISGAIGTLPLKLFERLGEGGKQPALDHPAYALVHDDANEWISSAALREQLAIDALLHGDGFAYVNRVDGRAVELIRVHPENVTVLVDSETTEPTYKVQFDSTGGDERILSYHDVLHVRSPISTNGITGLSPISLCREAIGLALVLEQHASRLFGRGARPSGLLKHPRKIDSETRNRLSNSFNSGDGASTVGKTPLLEDGLDFQPISYTSVDSQFAEMRAFQIIEIARAFRVPPVLIADYSRATWSNSEEMGRQFLQYCLLPWLRAFEAAYRRVLLSHEERQVYSIEFVVDDLLRGDTAQRGQFYSQLRAAGIATANEIRAFENLPARADGDTLQNPFTSSGKAAT